MAVRFLKKKKIKLILASASPRRRQLLKKLRIPFRVMASHIPETTTHKNPIKLVEDLAHRKAKAIAGALIRPPDTFSLKGEGLRRVPSPFRETGRTTIPIARPVPVRYGRVPKGRVRGPFILGADTVVVLHHQILGKPRDIDDACRMLGRLSGSTHEVFTGVALIDAATQKAIVAHAKSVVRMRIIPPEERRRLARLHLDKAGSYAIQEKRDPIARVVKGSYDNVVGLPVDLVRTLLKKLSRAV